MRFAFRSTPLFHRHFIIHPVLFILCFFSVRISCHLSSQLHPLLFHILNHWPIYVWVMHSVSWVIYSSSSRCEWQSVLCYLLYVGLIRVSCVILTFILSSATRVNLIRLCTVGIMRCLSHMFYSYCFETYKNYRNLYNSLIRTSKKLFLNNNLLCTNLTPKRLGNLSI